jgi:cobalamin synthase
MPVFERPGDADRRPSLTTQLVTGRSHEDGLADAGDYWDWFVVTPTTAGTLTVIVDR